MRDWSEEVAWTDDAGIPDEYEHDDDCWSSWHDDDYVFETDYDPDWEREEYHNDEDS